MIAVIRECLVEAVSQARAGKFLPVGLLAAVAGCALLMIRASVWLMFASGGAQCAVEGSVRFNGKEIRQGEATFSPMTVADGQRRSTVITNGAFSLPRSRGLIRGHDYAVEIRGMRPTGKTYASQGQLVDELEQFVPERFNTSSELRVRPSSSTSRLEFNLEP
jgi:hypothetical protein